MRITRFEAGGSVTQLRLDAPDALEDATLLWLGPGDVSLGTDQQQSQSFSAWGFTFKAVTTTLQQPVATA